MIFALYFVLLVFGMWTIGASFAAPALNGLIFVAGVLCVTAAVAVPVTVQRLENPSSHITDWRSGAQNDR